MVCWKRKRLWGALIAPHDEVVFADKVYALLSDKTQCNALGKAAHHYAKTRWTDRAQAERMINFYTDVTTSI